MSTITEQTSAPPAAAATTSPLAWQILVAGCHGGAGTTTVARMLANAVDVGLERPNPGDAALVLVTRGTPYGARCATEVLTSARQAGIQPTALVVVGDGPWPEPRLAALRLRMLDGLVPTLVRLPYVMRWRYLEDPLAHPLPRKITSAVRHISSLVPPNPSGR